MQIDIPKCEQNKLEQLAAAQGFGSVEEFASQILLAAAHIDVTPPSAPAALDNGKQSLSAYDIAKQMGLVGMSSDGPTDLATNPAHMEGFGQDGAERSPR